MKASERTMLRDHETWMRMRVKSFGYAWNGIIQFFKTEPNAQLHLAATVIVVALSVVLKITKGEALIILFAIAVVWITEMINTAIEKVMDFMSVQRHPQIRFIKDVAAGAVLIASIAALVAGMIIFIPKILML
jgi:diacylglycerol kinase